MNLEEKYLIVSDLDGTFFGANSTLCPRNIEAIRAFQAKGGMFTIATGRSAAILKIIFPNVEDVVSGPAVISGGASLYDYKTGTILDKRELDKDIALRIIEETRIKFPGAGYRICTDTGFLTDHLTDHLAKILMKRYSSALTVDSLSRHIGEAWYKLTYDVPAVDKPALQAHLESYRPKVFVSGSSPRLTEILNPRASKGQLIGQLKALYPGRTIICVGDYDNDLDMLLAADIAACPANANDSVKGISKIHLCDHKEGCIADLIERLSTQN